MPTETTVSGECRCHGVIVTGSKGTVAQPRPYQHRDLFTGKTVRCVAVLVPGQSMPHDVPVANLKEN